eukprot:SAG31_NODE_535_length_14348_cov_11.339603_7_plen_137_part_00
MQLDGDWRQKCKQIVKLRRAFDLANYDGNDELEKKELKLILASLNPKRAPSEEQIDELWSVMLNGAGLDEDQDARLDWASFLRGMAAVTMNTQAERFMDLMDIDQPLGFPLISLLIDIKASKSKAAEITASWTMFV